MPDPTPSRHHGRILRDNSLPILALESSLRELLCLVPKYLNHASSVEIASLESEPEATKAYLVGGLVRDLLLNESRNESSFMPQEIDLDIMIAPEHLSFIKFLESEETGLFAGLRPKDQQQSVALRKVTIFKKYRTAKVYLENFGLACLDFSGARKDVYTVPGEPPTVGPGSLLEDLNRRDFSVNTLALELNESGEHRLVDMLGGGEDLDQRDLRVLHADSFFEDPARLIRGARFRLRLGFDYSSDTKELVEEAFRKSYLSSLPKFRLLAELRKCAEEPRLASLLFAPEIQAAFKVIELDWRERFSSFDLEKLASIDSDPRGSVALEEIIRLKSVFIETLKFFAN